MKWFEELETRDEGTTKVLVCGSRNAPTSLKPTVERELLRLRPSTVIQGGASGIDLLASRIAEAAGIEVLTFEAEWQKYGKRAGPIRNQRMLEKCPDIVLAFHPKEGITPGTADMVNRARKKGLKVIVVTY